MELLIAFAVLAACLAFFMKVCISVTESEERMYQRRLQEAREFGYDDTEKHTIHTLNGRYPNKK